MISYEKLLESIRVIPKDTLKRVIFELDQDTIKSIKKMDLDKETERKLILIAKDHTFMEMLLVNTLCKD